MNVCHYCGEKYEVTTDLEESYADEEHPVCSSCLFDVITNDEEIEPLPRFVEDDDDDREVATDGGRDLNGHWLNDNESWCPDCQRYRVSCAHLDGGEQR